MSKKILFVIEMLVALILICSTAYAAVDTTLVFSANKTTIKQGEEFTVTISLKDVKSTAKITSVSGYINYNKNVLETITVDSIEKNSNGKIKIGTEELPVEDLTNRTIDNMPSSDAYVGFNSKPTSGNDIKILIDFESGVASDTDLLTFKLKVKSDATVGKVSDLIKFSTFNVVAGSEKSIDISNSISATIEKASASEEKKDTDTNKESSTSNNNDDSAKEEKSSSEANSNPLTNNDKTANTSGTDNTKKESDTSKTSSTIKTSDTANTILPATGVKSIFLVGAFLVGIVFVFYLGYNKYKKI